MPKNFAQQWLNIQCLSINGLEMAVFLLVDQQTQTLTPAAQWPAESPPALELMAIAQIAVKTQAPLINPNITGVANPALTFDYLALPIVNGQQVLGVLAVKTSHQDHAGQQQLLAALNVGNKWLALPPPDQDAFYATAVKLAVACLGQHSVSDLCNTLINAVSHEFACDRVAVGSYANGHAQVIALSNSAKFDHKTQLLQTLAEAIAEAIDQDQVLVYPLPEPGAHTVSYAHAELADKFGCGAVCTLPLAHDGAVFAALTLERSSSQPFDPATIQCCEQALALIVPYLFTLQQTELPLLNKLGLTLKKSWFGLVGFKHAGIKLAALATLLFLATAWMLEGDFRIHADAVLEGRIQRTISAPMAGFIQAASKRAGDTVEKDEIIATLEDSDLKLEQTKLVGQQQQLQREYREAMAKRDLVQIQVLNSQMGQVAAQITLTTEQLQRTRIQAPFAGVIIEGDLSQALSAPVERGASLFKIAPLDGYRVILKIHERNISYIQTAQLGNLKLSSLPEQKFPLRVEKITHVASIDADSNIFRVEASLVDMPKLLRPGMEGVAKIDAGQRPFLWIWTHELIDWLSLWVWSWWP